MESEKARLDETRIQVRRRAMQAVKIKWRATVLAGGPWVSEVGDGAVG